MFGSPTISLYSCNHSRPKSTKSSVIAVASAADDVFTVHRCKASQQDSGETLPNIAEVQNPINLEFCSFKNKYPLNKIHMRASSIVSEILVYICIFSYDHTWRHPHIC